MASQRLPGKPLRTVSDGKTLLELTFAAARRAGLGQVFVAASDVEIIRFCFDRNMPFIETPEAANGTQRVVMALQHLSDHSQYYDICVNLQCDEPLVKPEDLGRLIKCVNKSHDFREIATFTAPLLDEDKHNGNIVKTVGSNYCHWFTRHWVPGAVQHVGVYAFPTVFGMLEELSEPPSALALVESLEQITWLEHGVRICPVHLEQAPLAINTEHDLEMLRKGEYK
jgi:3-deoxy-manno-octulosonate cytidylyltransferase (CMP-KDO synthetase)